MDCYAALDLEERCLMPYLPQASFTDTWQRKDLRIRQNINLGQIGEPESLQLCGQPGMQAAIIQIVFVPTVRVRH